MTGRRLGLALAVLAGAAQCGTTGTPPTSHAFPIQEYTLPSGLKLVIEQDDIAKTAGIVVVVDAGLVDSPPGKAGIAHVLEHLVFRVPDEKGESLWNRLITLGAASFNAETGIERTTYHAFGPRQSLDELVTLMLRRLADPLRGATDAHVAKEVSITGEEVRRREGVAGYEVLMPELLPPGDPVGRAFADRVRPDPVSLADVRAFADVFYRPERMTVVISGPVPSGWDQKLWTMLPPLLHGRDDSRKAPIRRPSATFPGPARAENELPPRPAHVTVPELWIAWRVPPSVGVTERTAYMMAAVIEQVLSSRLDLDGTNDVLDVDGFALPGRLSTAVGCRFKLRNVADATRIRNETRAAIEALSDATLVYNKGRLYWSHVRALRSAMLTTALGMESIQGRAIARAELVHAGSSALISNVLGALEKVTIEDVSDFATRYLKPDAARAVLVVPQSMQATAGRHSTSISKQDPVIRPGTESPTDLQQPDDQTDERPDPARLLAITQVPGATPAVVRKLANGLTVMALRKPGLPFVSMLLGFHCDPQPGDAPGARIAFGPAMRWTASEGPLERGVLHTWNHYADRSLETFTMFSASVEGALDFLGEEADSLHIYWPTPAFERWVTETASWEAAPEGRAAHAFRKALFGAHPYRLLPATWESKGVTAREVEAFFARVRRPANAALVVVGEMDAEAVIRDTGKALSGWKGDAAAPPAAPAPPQRIWNAVTPRPAIVHTQDARRQTADVQFGCFLPPVRDPRDRITNELLSELLASDLLSRLRSGLGVSYAPSVTAESVRGGTAWLDGRVDIDARSQEEALKILRAWLDPKVPFPIDSKLFERLRWGMARRSGLANVTGQQLAWSLFDAWNMGWEPKVLDEYPRQLASVTFADLVSALDACRTTAVISVLGPGSPP